VLGPDEQEYVKEVLAEMCLKVTKHRIMLKPTFQDFDRRYEDHVSKEQFMRALSMFHLLPQSSYAIDALCQAFSPTSFRHAAGLFVNYRKFLDYIQGIVSITERQQMALSADAYKDVPRHLRSDFTPGEVADGVAVKVEWEEEEEEEKKKGDALEDFVGGFDGGGMSVGSQSPSKISVITGRPEKSYQTVVDDIRKSVLQKRIRLQTFFEDQDKLRKGKLTKDQFYKGLTSAGQRLSENEVVLLAGEYGCLDDTDAKGEPLVRWVDFCNDIDAVFTVSGLETQPNLDVVSTIRSIRANFNDTASVSLLDDDENKVLAGYLAEVSTDVGKKCINLFPPFEDFDRFHRGTVTAGMFGRVLSGLGYYPSDKVFNLLVEKFQDTPVDSQKDVNYKAFIAVLDMITQGTDAGDVPSAMQYKMEQTADSVVPFDPSEYVEKSPQKPAGFFDPPIGDIADTLEEVRRQCDYHKVRLADFLADGDRLRSGDLTTSKFRNGLARAGVDLNGTGEGGGVM